MYVTNLCIHLNKRRKRWMLTIAFILSSCLFQASFAFVVTTTRNYNCQQQRQRPRTMVVRYAQEEKKEDGVVYWEAGMSNVELPSLTTMPKMIVFDKDGTLGDDAASLKRWVQHMTNRLSKALEYELHKQPAEIQRDVDALHESLGWDSSVGHVIPSAPLAAGTWEEAVERCSTVFQKFGLSENVASAWHAELKNVHGADPPTIPNLAEMLQDCHDLGMIVAVCTSDNRIPTDAALENWKITHLINLSLCGDEVMEAKPSAVPLEMLCQETSLTPQDCIVVGDTTGDTGMARNAEAGLCIGVLTGSGTADQLMETGANVILPSVGEIPALLQCMGMEKKKEPQFEGQLIDEEALVETIGNATVVVS